MLAVDPVQRAQRFSQRWHVAIIRKKRRENAPAGKNANAISTLRCSTNRPQFPRERKVDVFQAKRAALDGSAIARFQIIDALGHNRFRRARPRSNDDRFYAFEPLVLNILGAINKLRSDARLFRDFLESLAVGAVLTAQNEP